MGNGTARRLSQEPGPQSQDAGGWVATPRPPARWYFWLSPQLPWWHEIYTVKIEAGSPASFSLRSYLLWSRQICDNGLFLGKFLGVLQSVCELASLQVPAAICRPLPLGFLCLRVCGQLPQIGAQSQSPRAQHHTHFPFPASTSSLCVALINGSCVLCLIQSVNGLFISTPSEMEATLCSSLGLLEELESRRL